MDYLIKEYIKKIEINDIEEFAKKKNIILSHTDAIIIYTYIKKHYQDLLNGKDQEIIKELKNKLSPNTFKEAYKLYLEYKIKYLS